MSQAQSSSAVTGLIYLLVAFLCAIASAYSVFHGFTRLGLLPASVFAAILFLALFACHYFILRVRQSGGRLVQPRFELLGPVLLLVFVTLLTISSSGSYFFRLAMRDTLAVETADKARTQFEENVSAALVELGKQESYSVEENAILTELGRLRRQVENIENSGFGKEAMQHRANIYAGLRQMGANPTDLKTPRPPGSEKDNQDALKEHESLVRYELGELAKNDKSYQAIQRIEDRRDDLEPILSAISGSKGQLKFETLVDHVHEIEVATTDVERIANEQLLRSEGQEPLGLRPVFSDGMALDSIPQVVKMVFEERRAVGIGIVSVFAAVLLDLLPLFMALVFIPVDGPRSARGDNPRPVRPGGKGGVTITPSARRGATMDQD